MLLAFHNAFTNSRIQGSAIDFLLPALTRSLQTDFCHFVDGGAGIGHTGMEYSRILDECLNGPNGEQASITCYEPLPENFEVMSTRLTDKKRFRLRCVAVSSLNKMLTFAVPHRQTADNGAWGIGTSFNGFIDDGKTHIGREMIEVAAVRLEGDLVVPPDFVKLDLQGGELEAIKGLGNMLDQVKVLYIETQLMRNEHACQYLLDNGFAILYDKLQIGLLAGTREVPIKPFERLGIAIDKMQLPNGTGMPLVIFGHLEEGHDLFDGFHFKQETKDRLKKIGVSYLQTDAICINTRYSKEIFTELQSII